MSGLAPPGPMGPVASIPAIRTTTIHHDMGQGPPRGLLIRRRGSSTDNLEVLLVPTLFDRNPIPILFVECFPLQDSIPNDSYRLYFWT